MPSRRNTAEISGLPSRASRHADRVEHFGGAGLDVLGERARPLLQIDLGLHRGDERMIDALGLELGDDLLGLVKAAGIAEHARIGLDDAGDERVGLPGLLGEFERLGAIALDVGHHGAVEDEEILEPTPARSR